MSKLEEINSLNFENITLYDIEVLHTKRFIAVCGNRKLIKFIYRN